MFRSNVKLDKNILFYLISFLAAIAAAFSNANRRLANAQNVEKVKIIIIVVQSDFKFSLFAKDFRLFQRFNIFA